jgi:hypothetical protein
MKIVTEGLIEKGLFRFSRALDEVATVCRISYNAGGNSVKDDTLIFVQLRLKLVNYMLFVLVVIVKLAGNQRIP